MRVVKHAAVVVVDVALRRRALGDDHIVAVELDMEILDLVDPLRLKDRYQIDQIAHLDQYPFEIHCVMRRNPQLAPRHTVGQCTCPDADRQDVGLPQREASGIAAPADPLDWPRHARRGDDPVADRQIFDRHLAPLGICPRPADDTGPSAVCGMVIEPAPAMPEEGSKFPPGILTWPGSGSLPRVLR